MLVLYLVVVASLMLYEMQGIILVRPPSPPDTDLRVKLTCTTIVLVGPDVALVTKCWSHWMWGVTVTVREVLAGLGPSTTSTD